MSDFAPHSHSPHDDDHSSSDDGSLLFDPNASVPDVDFDRPGRASAFGRPGGFWLGVGVGGGIAVIALAVVAFRALGGAPDEGPVGPEPLPTVERAALLSVLPDSFLNAAVGDTVDVTVLVTAAVGTPLADTIVLFRLTEGVGLLTDSAVSTDSTGRASTRLIVAEQPGITTVSAALPDGQARPGIVRVTTGAGAPASIAIRAGNRQEGAMGELLPGRVAIVVTDEAGNAVPNAEVRFRVDMGEGVTAPTQTRTDSTGRASALWRLGSMEGRHQLTASATGVGASVTFIATALGLASPDDPGSGRIESAAVEVVRASIAVGGGHVCTTNSGSVLCRGGNDRGQTVGSGAQGYVALTAGAAHACGLDAGGAAACWGGNERGQLGDGSRIDRTQPTSVRTELNFSTLAAGASHTCGLAGGGVPLCWGLNINGQLGDGSRNDQTAPRTVGGGILFRSISAGWNHTCGLTENGNAFCWGLNSQGQLGDGSNLDQLLPTLVHGAVETIVAGSAHTCGVSDGEILCWGGNTFGQLGDGTREDRSRPTAVSGLPGRPVSLAAGAVHTCALVQGGAAYCWGQNLQGQLGDGSTENRSEPVLVGGGLTFTELHAGGALTCGLTRDGVEYCWGLNRNGQLGDGTRVSRSTPTRVLN